MKTIFYLKRALTNNNPFWPSADLITASFVFKETKVGQKFRILKSRHDEVLGRDITKKELLKLLDKEIGSNAR